MIDTTIQDEFTHLNLSRQRKYQLRRMRDRRCVLCGKPANAPPYCKKHARSRRDYELREKKDRVRSRWLRMTTQRYADLWEQCAAIVREMKTLATELERYYRENPE